MRIQTNPELTRSRIDKLQSYIRSELISSERSFICTDSPVCRESRRSSPFYGGQMSHVGCHYDLEVDSRPMRIVFLGQEYGKTLRCVDLEQRSQMLSDYAENYGNRSTHMRGVTSTLRLLLGREPGLDQEGEQLVPGAHIFEGFALVNYLLCTALKKSRDPSKIGGGKGYSSSAMQRNCARHLKATLEILEPTVIVVHGQKVRNWMVKNLSLEPRNSPEVMRINSNWVDVLTFDHPSAGGKSGYWGNSVNSRYLKEYVVPTVKSYLSKH